MRIVPIRQGPVHRLLMVLAWIAPVLFIWPFFLNPAPDILPAMPPALAFALRLILMVAVFAWYYETVRPELEGLLHFVRTRRQKEREEFQQRCLSVSTGGEIIKETLDRLAALLDTRHVVAVHYDSTGHPVVTGGGSEYERFLLHPQSLPEASARNAEDLRRRNPELFSFMEEHAMKSVVPLRQDDLLLAVFFLGESLQGQRERDTLRALRDVRPPLARVYYRNRLEYIQRSMELLESELRDAEYRKDLLLSNVSHEMKTPLTTILGMVEILLYAWIDDEKANAEYFKIVSLEARRLKELLEDLQIAAGITPREDPSSRQVKSMLKAKLGSLAHLLEDRGMKVEWRLNLPNDRPGRNARLYLPIIVRHLLTNAIRFNSTGQATIQIAGNQSEDTNLLQIVIKDNGPGIELDQLQHVTDPFYRVDSELTYEVPGIGLGLFLVKTLTRKLEGTFHIDSDAGSGTEVTLGIPLYSEGDNLRVYEDLEKMRKIFERAGLRLHVTDTDRPPPEISDDEDEDLLWAGNIEGPAGPAFHATIFGQTRPEILNLARQSLELLARMDWREAELQDLTEEIGYNYEELSLLSALSEKLSMREDARNTIDIAVQDAAELVNFNRSFVAEFTDKDQLSLTWSTSARDQIGRELPEDIRSVCQRAINQRQNIQEEMDRSLLVILPLMPFSDRPAVMVFERFNLKNPFTSIDINFLDAVATQLAGKLQNLRYTDREKYLRRIFQRFTPARVVDSVMNSNVEPPGASRRVGAILYADFSDFSRLSDEMAPEDAMELLNEFLGYMIAPLTEEQGSVENFFGIGMVALFYQDPGRENLIVRAVRAALKMQTNRAAFNRARSSQDRPTLMTGIGIHYGASLLGEAGSDRSRFSTVIGEAVQVAARLAHRATHIDTGILVTEAVFHECRDFFSFQDTQYNIREIPGILYRAFVPGSDPGSQELIAK